MRFFIENEALDEAVREIRKKIRVSMNGVVADSMRLHGVIYKKNFGVDIPRLKQIAAQYTPNHDLAQRLWALKIRETMILASLLQPAEKMPLQLADAWMDDIQQLEMAEQTTMNLFVKLPYADSAAMRWIHSDELWRQITGLLLIARLWHRLADEQAVQIIERTLCMADTDETTLFKAVALALCRLSRRNKETAERILKDIRVFGQAERFSLRYIYLEVSQEISLADI